MQGLIYVCGLNYSLWYLCIAIKATTAMTKASAKAEQSNQPNILCSVIIFDG